MLAITVFYMTLKMHQIMARVSKLIAKIYKTIGQEV